MTKFRLLLAAGSCAGCLLSVPAIGFADDGFYLGAGVGVSNLEPETTGTGYSVGDSSSRGIKLYAGYELSERWALEAYYSDLGEAGILPGGSIGYRDMGVSAMYYLFQPEAGRQDGLSVFVRAGLGKMQNSTDLPYERINDTHLMLGAGAEYGLGGGWALRGDLDLYDKDSQFLALGLVKRFGGSKTVPVVPVKPAPVSEPVAEPAPEPVVAPPPPVDSDHDGVTDGIDQCPQSPEGATVDADGCSEVVVITLEGVNFALDSAELVGESREILDRVAARLTAVPTVAIEIQGHTDSQGSEQYNQDLSARRANAVRDYLVEQGLPAERLQARGLGELVPVADNATAAGRATNRRVELHIVRGAE